jgi:mono/diheme cytochrome c family protein
MPKIMTAVALAAAVGAALAADGARAEGDPEAGEALAREQCARCHNVEPNGPPKLYPPSFAAIAWYRTRDQIWARTMFPALHSAMPQVAPWLFSEEDMDDLIAYVVSLDRAGD